MRNPPAIVTGFIHRAALVARVKSMLRIKDLHDKVQKQTDVLAEQAIQLAGWNQTLGNRVQAQLAELERLGQLKRFFSPQIVKALMSDEGESLLSSHRREITVVFLDLRGFTAFSESTAPEDVVAVLRDYHAAMGKIIFEFDGTLEHFAGDGMMVFFNDPQPREEHGLQAARMALAMGDHMEELIGKWKRRGHNLGFGVGIAMGYATLGMIGFEGRLEYGAVGPVVNLASRLCEEAKGGEILISDRVLSEIEDSVEHDPPEKLQLKGFAQPVSAFKLLGLTSGEAAKKIG